MEEKDLEDVTKAPLSQIHVEKMTQLRLQLDDEKVRAIRACLDKGELTIRISDVDLSRSDRLQAAYIYD